MSSFIFTVLTTKYIYIHQHKPIHILISPNTLFSAIEYRIKAQSSENCLKILSDQKRQKTQVWTKCASYGW